MLGSGENAMSDVEETKRAAGVRSMDYIEDGMVVGIGTGSTARYMIEALAERVRGGLKIKGVPTSKTFGEMAAQQGIPMISLDEAGEIDVTIDGADEIGPGLALIKGGGGALLHEKIVATASKKMVVVVGEGKVVPLLGKFPLPVEVIPFAAAPVLRKLEALGIHPTRRPAKSGDGPYITDEGNWIFDCHCGTIPDPSSLGLAIRGITGVVEHGLFIDIASVAIVADERGVTLIER